jgi:hypothetical protein
MRNIKVSYDGSYPNACSGRLIISVYDEIVYNEEYSCSSTRSVWFDDEWSEHVECGELVWNDADKFEQDIQDAVEMELSKVHVCCGGCV